MVGNWSAGIWSCWAGSASGKGRVCATVSWSSFSRITGSEASSSSGVVVVVTPTSSRHMDCVSCVCLPPTSAVGFHFFGSEQRCEVVEHPVHVLVAVCAAKALGQLHRLVDRHFIRNIQAIDQFVGADPQHTVLHG